MATIQVGFDFAEYARRERAGAKRGAAARRWMAAQPGNVLAEARSRTTAPARLTEIAENGNAACRTAVAGNPATPHRTLLFLSTVDLITSEISQRLTRNPATPYGALKNVEASSFRSWFGNWDRIQAHPNWRVSQ